MDSQSAYRAPLTTRGSVVLDDWDPVTGTGWTYAFDKPQQILAARSREELSEALRSAEGLQSSGAYLAGYISYDAGLTLDKPLESRHSPNLPLMWLGVYDSMTRMPYGDARLDQWNDNGRVTNDSLNIAENDYIGGVQKIKDYIAAGDVYQVNYACKLLFENTGAASGLYSRLRRAHPVCHSAFIDTGEFQIVSLSPELFLRKTGRRLQTRPMKGTLPRGASESEDRRLAEALRGDEKTRAENLMIVDLMRNDLGRVCAYGSVRVPRLFSIERYPSLLQMTSEVEGDLRCRVSLPELLTATFPPGSVTGAPKLRALEIIDELETSARGVYCGAIGMFLPDGDLLLNVAIRTIVQRGRECEMGLGSGIVADSDPASELRETLLKGKFLRMGAE